MLYGQRVTLKPVVLNSFSYEKIRSETINP